ncbi:MAG: transcriptional regulator, partial [Bacteroidales bacterium]|nr:transcriptional regulator [Bacteroidales bacterium]
MLSVVLVTRGQNASPEIKQHILNQISIKDQNWNISQNDGNYLMYFANSEGLISYNGITSRLHRLPYDKNVRSVHVDDNGTVFTGTFEEFGYWKTNKIGELEYQPLSHLTHIQKNDDIWKIYELNQKIYFQSFTTIYVYDYQNIMAIKTPYIALFMFRAANGFIVQFIDNGLYWFNGTDFSFIPGSKPLGSMKVHAVIEKKDGKLLICTASHGIFIYDGKSFEPWNSEISGFLKEYTCNAGISIDDSLFIYGTILNGVVVCNEDGKIFKHYNFSNGLKNNTVLSLFTDTDKGLWVGLDEGINYIDILSPASYYANTSGTIGTIYSVF